MTVNTGTILLSLISGAVLGAIAVIFCFLGRINAGKWFCLLLQDMTLVVICFMVTFLVSFSISKGRIRSLQVILEAVSFLLVWFLLSPGAKKTSELYILMRNKAGTFLGKLRSASRKIADKTHKNSKKPKKRLAIPPSGNI